MFEFLTRLFTPREKSGAIMNSSWLGYEFSGSTSSGIHVNQLTALHDATVSAAVQILATDVAKLPLIISKKLSNGDRQPATDHYLYRLFRDPNNWQTRYEFIEHMMICLLLWGNSYAIILRDELGGEPKALIPINPSQVNIYESPVSTDYFYNIARTSAHETALLKSLPQQIHSEDVIHLRWMSYMHSLWGTNRTDLMRETIGLSIALEQSAARLMGNGARPSGVVTMEAVLQKEVLEGAIARWQQAQAGPNRNGGTAFLAPGQKFTPISWSSVDLQFMQQREFVISQVARSFRVPLYKLSLAESSPGASILQLEQDYLNSVIGSWCDRITSKLYKQFEIDPDEYVIEFDYSHSLKADQETQFNALRVAVIGGLITVNEARTQLGLPGVGADGDVILQATNLAPLGYDPTDDMATGGSPGSDTSGKPGAGGDGSGTEEK